MMKIVHVVGARPNFMKISPIMDAIRIYNKKCKVASHRIDQILVHTGQHYDTQMSDLFFNDLGIPVPDINLEVRSASHAVQTAEIMKRFEQVCLQEQPTHVLVVGDVNSTIACALVATKLASKVIHVEAGLRSFNRSMPEEINRILTDAISDILFTTEESANENLRKEGIPGEKIHFVGNVMIDTLLKHKKKAEQSQILRQLGLVRREPNGSTGGRRSVRSKETVRNYAVLTLHRPTNVDQKDSFRNILEALVVVAKEIPILFPIHPRTLSCVRVFGFEQYFDWTRYNSYNSGGPTAPCKSINVLPPLGYLDFLQLMSNAKLVLTDSGGIQEETTVLTIPCVTLRESTERPVTVTLGTNVVAGTHKEKIITAAMNQLFNRPAGHQNPPLWDGNAAERITKILLQKSQN